MEELKGEIKLIELHPNNEFEEDHSYKIQDNLPIEMVKFLSEKEIEKVPKRDLINKKIRQKNLIITRKKLSNSNETNLKDIIDNKIFSIFKIKDAFKDDFGFKKLDSILKKQIKENSNQINPIRNISSKIIITPTRRPTSLMQIIKKKQINLTNNGKFNRANIFVPSSSNNILNHKKNILKRNIVIL